VPRHTCDSAGGPSGAGNGGSIGGFSIADIPRSQSLL